MPTSVEVPLAHTSLCLTAAEEAARLVRGRAGKSTRRLRTAHVTPPAACTSRRPPERAGLVRLRPTARLSCCPRRCPAVRRCVSGPHSSRDDMRLDRSASWRLTPVCHRSTGPRLLSKFIEQLLRARFLITTRRSRVVDYCLIGSRLHGHASRSATWYSGPTSCTQQRRPYGEAAPIHGSVSSHCRTAACHRPANERLGLCRAPHPV